MQASGLALISKASPFTLGQAKSIRLRKHAQKTNKTLKERYPATWERRSSRGQRDQPTAALMEGGRRIRGANQTGQQR